MKTNIVEIKGQQTFTTSKIIADNCPTERKGKEYKRTNKSVVDLIKKYESEFASLGEIDFQSLFLGQGKDSTVVNLNEDQATFLITLFTNTKQVIAFKLRLVKEFRKAIDEVARLYANPPRRGIIQAKRDAHKVMMDELVESRAIQGKDTVAHNFMCENKLCNWAVTGKFSNAPEKELSNEDAALLEECRKRNTAYMMSGLEYEDRKKRLQAYVMRYRTKLIGAQV
jgi:hypothetical protein